MTLARNHVMLELDSRVRPCPLLVARALSSGHEVAVLGSLGVATWSHDTRVSYVAVDPSDESYALLPPHHEALHEAGRGNMGEPAPPRWIGVIPYEHLRALERRAWVREERRAAPMMTRPTWRKYDACVSVAHATGRVTVHAGSWAHAAELRDAVYAGLSREAPRGELRRVAPDAATHRADHEAHAERIARALSLIARGDIYQVNLARRLTYTLDGDALAVFASWMRRAPAPFGFFGTFDGVTVLGGSPELALAVRGPNMWTCPIKGTRPRGAHAEEDRALGVALSESEKERAELTMAIDLHRNDLGKVAAFGTVRVPFSPKIVRASRVMSRLAEITARRSAGASLEDCVRAMLPCGSVTGAPKVRAMEIIAALEPSRRGLYTGAYGMLSLDGSLTLAMAIRTLTVPASPARVRVAEYFSGGGIVAGSEPTAEVTETEWKALENLAADPEAR